MFGEKISASPGSSKEIAGLLTKMMIMMMMMMMKNDENREIMYERILAWKTGGRYERARQLDMSLKVVISSASN